MEKIDKGGRPAPLEASRRAPTAKDLDSLTHEERTVLARVADVLRRIQFGSVLIVVQDGKVVQIEMAEKFRLR